MEFEMKNKKILLTLAALVIIGTSAVSELFADFHVACSAGKCCCVYDGKPISGKLEAIIVY
jgi:DNA transposition AAA+ family ATPase